MSDILFVEKISLDSYQNFVQVERKPNETFEDAWDAKRADDVLAEGYEFLYQHGPGMELLVAGPDWPHEYEQRFPELRNNMIDELGDMLWFDFDIINHHAFDPSDVTSRALQSHTNSNQQFTNFADLQKAVTENAQKIQLPESYSLFASRDNEKGTSLADHPGYVLSRMQVRLVTALRQQGVNPSQESNDELALALGDHINALAYISASKLGMDVNDVARYNVYKLRHRKKFGKATGHLLSSSKMS